MKPSPQTVKVVTASEDEISPETDVVLSWKTIFAAGITVEDFPDVEAPLVVDIIDAFLIRMSNESPKMVKGGLAKEYGIDLAQLTGLIRFLNEDRIKVSGVVLRSPE